MRFAVLADIHGNLAALEAVLQDLRDTAPDAVLNLGDHLSGPLEAAATADLLMSLNFINIRGNHDRQLIDRPWAQMGLSDQTAFPELRAAHFEWLRALPPSQDLDPGILLCHGTPASDLEYLVEEITPEGLRLASTEYTRQQLGHSVPGVVLCGHSHIPRTVRNGKTLIVNPGSVGLPAYEDALPWPHFVETGSPFARYALLELRNRAWNVSHRALPYDLHRSAAIARSKGRPDWAHALTTGFGLRSGN